MTDQKQTPAEELLIKQAIYGQASLAIQIAFENHRDVNSLVYRPDVGVIDIRIGDSKSGLLHIVNQRQRDGTLTIQSQKEMFNDLALCIGFGSIERKIQSEMSLRLELGLGQIGVIVTRNAGENAWVLTGWTISREFLQELGRLPLSERRKVFLQKKTARDYESPSRGSSKDSVER